MKYPFHLVLTASLLVSCGKVAPGSDAASCVSESRIVYESRRALDGTDADHGHYNLWIMDLDGAHATPLTRLDSSSVGTISPSPDGTRLIYTVSAGTTSNLWSMNTDGTGVTALTHLTASSVTVTRPSFSPDAKKILYASNRALDGSDALNTHSISNIWLMNADGTGDAPLTQLTATSSSSRNPVFSPDGKTIAYDSQRALNGANLANTNLVSNIWAMNTDGTSSAPLTSLTSATAANSSLPVFDPAGAKIAYTSQRALDGSNAGNMNAVNNVWLMNADGSSGAALTTMTAGTGDCFFPAFSADSSRLLYFSGRVPAGTNSTQPAMNVWSIGADASANTALTRLTALNASSYDSRFTPDGTKIVYRSQRALDGTDAVGANSTQNLWIMNADGTASAPLTSLTAATADSFQPIFAKVCR